MHPDERFVAFFDRRTFHCHAVDRIRPVENDNSHAALFTRAHAKIERPNKGVIATPDVLKIDQKNIEILEHLRGRLTMFAVETVNRNVQPRMFVILPLDHVVLRLTEKSVLRTEKRAQSKQVAV